MLSTVVPKLNIIGYSISFGVFQKFYTTHKGIEGSPGAVATVGTTLNGLMYLMMPLTFTLLTKYPRLRPYTGPVGLFIAVASLIISSYATQVWQLIASQGVLCAIVSVKLSFWPFANEFPIGTVIDLHCRGLVCSFRQPHFIWTNGLLPEKDWLMGLCGLVKHQLELLSHS